MLSGLRAGRAAMWISPTCFFLYYTVLRYVSFFQVILRCAVFSFLGYPHCTRWHFVITRLLYNIVYPLYRPKAK